MKSLYQYILKRTLYSTLILWIVSVVIFLFTQGLPGSAAHMQLGVHATEAQVEILEETLGLDRPLHIQYIDWLTGFIVGDWGVSSMQFMPVTELVIPRLIRSLQLAVISLTVIAILGISLGVVSAVKRGTLADTAIVSTTYVGLSVPGFVTGIILILLFAGPVFNIFPSSGHAPLSEGIVPFLRHMALPVITLSIIGTAHTLRQTRTGVIKALDSEYVRTAHLKGINKWRVIIKHGLRNGLIATVTILALSFGWLMGSLVVIEEVFAYPGLGRLLVASILDRDVPVIQAVVLIIAASYTFANLAADIIYAYLDPRIEYE